jgi:hypothetical protein
MIIAIGGWRGVGATTTGLLLASWLAEFGGACWLIEADPAGGVLAGRMGLPPSAIGGLERVAFPSDDVPFEQALRAVALPSAGLTIVSAPADPFRAHACHRPRRPWQRSLRELDADVVVDVGRIRAGTPAWPLLTVADAVVLVGTAEVVSVVSSVEWIDALGRVSTEDVGLDEGIARLVVVDAPGGQNFARSVLRSELGDRFAGWIPWDVTAVDLLHRGVAVSSRGMRRSSMVEAGEALARHLVEAVQGSSKEMVR